jgi:hypothetical protein
MEAPEPLPPEVLAALPPAVVAFIYWQAEQIHALTARVAELQAKLGKDSSNSSVPPSASHPHAKPPRPRPKSPRRPGGQPGHPKHERALIPTQQCQHVVACVPAACRRCGRALSGTDTAPLRPQVWELPDIQPIVTEYQLHRLVCACGCSTAAPLPPGVPAGQAGPRLIAFAGLLMACFRQSNQRLGYDLMRPTKQLFALWQKVRDGTLSRGAFRRRMRPIREEVEEYLLRGYFDARLHGFCKELYEHREWLWTFVDVAGVEPTNNAAERALRHAVIWRKLSFGTQSAGGSRFVERMLTVIETCRRQGRDAFAWLVSAVQADLLHQAPPSLLPAP